jgi:hypothetical protein
MQTKLVRFFLIAFAALLAAMILLALHAKEHRREPPQSIPVEVSPPQQLTDEIAKLLGAKVKVEHLVVQWRDECRAHAIGLLLPSATTTADAVGARIAIAEVMAARCKQQADDYTVWHANLDPTKPGWLTLLLANISFGACFIGICAYSDWRIRGQGRSVEQYKSIIRRLQAAMARDQGRLLFVRALYAADRLLSDLFSRRLISPTSILMASLISLTMNCYLAYVPMLASLSHEAIDIMFSRISLVAFPLAVAAINVPLDVLAWIAMRQLLRRVQHPGVGRSHRKMLPGTRSLMSLLLIGWFIAGLSTLLGALMGHLVHLPIFSSETWTRIIMPLAAHWYAGAILNPFHSNVEVNGLNLGYLAFGAVITWGLLLCMVSFLFLWKHGSRIVYSELMGTIRNLADEEKKFFTTLGSLAVGGMTLLAWIGHATLWLIR